MTETPTQSRRTPRIGVTGGIGAGKSAFCAALGRAGAAVFSADDAVHDLYRDDDVVEQVVARWGADVIDDDGNVDRKAIAAIVFSDETERQWLEGLLHPLVARAWLIFADQHGGEGASVPAVVGEVPLLFEAGMDTRYDVSVAVIANDDVRRTRLRKQHGEGARLDSRGAAQLSQDDKAARADHVIVNDGDLAALDAAAIDLLERYA